MKLPGIMRPKKAVAVEPSETTTVAPSPNHSVSNLEKSSNIEPSRTSSNRSKNSRIIGEKGLLKEDGVHHSGEQKVVETTGLEEAEALDKLSEEPEYPTGMKLAIITIALCFSVFLVAIV